MFMWHVSFVCLQNISVIWSSRRWLQDSW